MAKEVVLLKMVYFQVSQIIEEKNNWVNGIFHISDNDLVAEKENINSPRVKK